MLNNGVNGCADLTWVMQVPEELMYILLIEGRQCRAELEVENTHTCQLEAAYSKACSLVGSKA